MPDVRGCRPSSWFSRLHPQTDTSWPLRRSLSQPSPAGFGQALSWKGDWSLWRAPEASADFSIFPHDEVGNLLLVISATFLAETHTPVSRYSVVLPAPGRKLVRFYQIGFA